MSKGKVAIFVAAALVAGLALGSVGIASAATSATRTAGPVAGFVGICRTAGASLADVVARLTGKTTADIYAERKAGKSFATIASENGVSSATVVSEALRARKAALDAAVAAGTITRARADLMYDRMDDRIPARVDSAAPAGCDGTGPGAGRGQGRGMMGGGSGGSRGAGAGACGGACANQ
ncbi:MAG: hypothetical protein WC971_04800 [Coriobacteriia bacterium]